MNVTLVVACGPVMMAVFAMVDAEALLPSNRCQSCGSGGVPGTATAVHFRIPPQVPVLNRIERPLYVASPLIEGVDDTHITTLVEARYAWARHRAYVERAVLSRDLLVNALRTGWGDLF